MGKIDSESNLEESKKEFKINPEKLSIFLENFIKQHMKKLGREGAIGISYEKLDLILLALEKGWENSESAKVLGIEEKWVVYVNDLIKRSEHMRKIYVPDRFG